jgi:hypothetical protein
MPLTLLSVGVDRLKFVLDGPTIDNQTYHARPGALEPRAGTGKNLNDALTVGRRAHASETLPARVRREGIGAHQWQGDVSLTGRRLGGAAPLPTAA